MADLVYVRRLWPGHVPLEWWLAEVAHGAKKHIVGRALWTNDKSEAWLMTWREANDFLLDWSRYANGRDTDSGEASLIGIIPVIVPAEG